MADIHRVTTDIILAPSPDLQPAPFFTPTPKAAKRVLEFFHRPDQPINNDHTRRAYMNATRRFAAWGAQRTSTSFPASSLSMLPLSLKTCRPRCRRRPSSRHLAALRMLFDWLVTGHVIDLNPAHAVRGPKICRQKGKTPVLTADEASTLLDSIPIVKGAAEDDAAVEPARPRRVT